MTVGLFYDRTDPTSPPGGRPNLWTAPHSGPNSPAGAPGSAPATMGAGVPPAGPSPVHPGTGLHAATLRHVANHLHGMAAALDGQPQIHPQSPVGTLLHQPTLHAISAATRNMGNGTAPAGNGMTINRVA